ncbi:MAG: GTP 3',8-cyclase MoaA [Candidatus Nitrosocosmicus sp.]|nr:GTP 3',8-cyclase MoaA [Candidatus Nitrosocosmicus sp.]
MNDPLKDSFGRVAKKLRISVTDRCNMRCVYCMPDNNTEWLSQKNLLSYEQMIQIVKVFTLFGIEKLKITGGEPLIRKDIETLVKGLSNIDHIRSLSMTTNGLLLKNKITSLKNSGLNSINISLDTFDRTRFKKISGVDGVSTVREAIMAAIKEKIVVKINTVIMRGWNDDEILDFVKFSRDTGCPVKFIEFMPLDGTGIWSKDLVVSKKEMMDKISKEFGRLFDLKNDAADPARLYTFKDCIGVIGFIPSITEPFCQSCDRIRVTADGKLYGCLFDNRNHDLKCLLDNSKSDNEIYEYIQKCIRQKPEGIVRIIRNQSLVPNMNDMYSIGG